MTVSEKIAEKKAKIITAQERISKEQEKVANLRKEIEILESLEVKAILKEIDLPLDQIKELLKSMKLTPRITLGNEKKDNE